MNGKIIGKYMGWEYEMMGSKWENNGDMMGKNGIGMGNAQRFTKSSLGLLFSRSGVEQGILDSTRSAKKCRKKTSHRPLRWTMQGLFFTFERLSQDATFCPTQNARCCPKTLLCSSKTLISSKGQILTFSPFLFFSLLLPLFSAARPRSLPRFSLFFPGTSMA